MFWHVVRALGLLVLVYDVVRLSINGYRWMVDDFKGDELLDTPERRRMMISAEREQRASDGGFLA